MTCRACNEDHIPHICERCKVDYAEFGAYDDHCIFDHNIYRCVCLHCRTPGERELWGYVDQMDISEPDDSINIQREQEADYRRDCLPPNHRY